MYIEPPRTDPYGNYVYPSSWFGGAAPGTYQACKPYTQGPSAHLNNWFVANPRLNNAYDRPYRYGVWWGDGDAVDRLDAGRRDVGWGFVLTLEFDEVGMGYIRCSAALLGRWGES